jgi:hypothetical protein
MCQRLFLLSSWLPENISFTPLSIASSPSSSLSVICWLIFRERRDFCLLPPAVRRYPGPNPWSKPLCPNPSTNNQTATQLNPIRLVLCLAAIAHAALGRRVHHTVVSGPNPVTFGASHLKILHCGF